MHSLNKFWRCLFNDGAIFFFYNQANHFTFISECLHFTFVKVYLFTNFENLFNQTGLIPHATIFIT